MRTKKEGSSVNCQTSVPKTLEVRENNLAHKHGGVGQAISAVTTRIDKTFLLFVGINRWQLGDRATMVGGGGAWQV